MIFLLVRCRYTVDSVDVDETICWTDQVHNPPVESHVTLNLKLCYKVIKQSKNFPPRFTVCHVKASCTSFGSSYGLGEDMSRQKLSTLLSLYYFSSPQPAFSFGPTVYVFDNPIFCSQVWLETSKEASIVECTAQINKKYGMQTGLKMLLNV